MYGSAPGLVGALRSEVCGGDEVRYIIMSSSYLILIRYVQMAGLNGINVDRSVPLCFIQELYFLYIQPLLRLYCTLCIA